MGKAHKVKRELVDANEMVFLIQTLKDIADNKYYTLSNKKIKFRRFTETFVEFFRMISLTAVKHPLLVNDNPNVGVVVVTIEGSFLGDFNNKIMRKAMEVKEKNQNVEFIAVGNKSVDRLSPYTPNLKIFSAMEATGLYETAIAVKDYLVEGVMNNKFGKVMVCYTFPRDFDTLRPRVVKLLPCDDLISKQAQTVETIENVIQESDPKDVIGVLSQLWLSTRLYEMFVDTLIASAAAQASFLEDSVDKQKKEAVKTKSRYRKAKKSDIDKSLRETFSARMMSMK